MTSRDDELAEARKNSRVANAVFAGHRVQLELDASVKSERARLLDSSNCLHVTPDPAELALEFEQQLHAQMATASPAEAFSLRERVGSAGGGRERGNSDALHELRREYSGQMLIARRSSNIELNDAILEMGSLSCHQRAWNFVKTMSRRALFLILLGLVSGLVAVVINVCIRQLNEAGLGIVATARNGGVAFVAYVCFTVLIIGIALAVTRFGSMLAAGSGIPEMKSILSGARMPQYLGLRTLLTKICGSVFAVGGNLTVGQEGPFVHIASSISHLLLRLPFFNVLGASEHYRQQMLSIGCGVGIAASFGAPFGGMLYAIETTSTYYSMDSYFPSFFACVVGAFVYRYVWNAVIGQQYWLSILQTQYPRVGVDIRFWDMLLFALLGALLAGAGVLLIKIFAHFAQWRNSLHAEYWMAGADSVPNVAASSSSSSSSPPPVALSRRSGLSDDSAEADNAAVAVAAAAAAMSASARPWYQRVFASPYVYTLTIVVLTAVLNFPGLIGDFMGLSTHDTLESLFGLAALDNAAAANAGPAKDWGTGLGVYLNLLVFTALRLLLCAVSLTLPLPAGMFMPCMAIGAGLGRFWGNAMAALFGASIAPGVFAVAGAAAMVASTTHSISTILILLEVTGQLYFAYPVTICVLAALFLSRRFSKSIYETIIESRHLPYLPTLKDRDLDRAVGGMMEPCPACVPKICPVSTMVRVLARHAQSTLPVVATEENRFFVGIIQRAHLERCVIDALQSALREIDFMLIHAPVVAETGEADSAGEGDAASYASGSASMAGSLLSSSASSTSASGRSGGGGGTGGLVLTQARVDELTAQRDLLLRLCKTALDPLHKHVVVRKDIDHEPLLRKMASFERPIELQYDATPVRFLKDTAVAHAHVLFILFRLDFGFVTERAALVGQISREAFVRGIHESH